MSIHVALHHKTTYTYDRPVALSPQVVRLRPAPHSKTPVLSYSLKIEPKDHFINWQQDPYGNYLARLVFPEKTKSFTVTTDLVADMTVINPFDFFLEESAEHFPFKYEPWLKQELKPFLVLEEAGELLPAFMASIKRDKRPIMDFLVELNQRLNQHIGYMIRLEPGVQSAEETLEKQSGSCRDSAWLLVQIMRRLGIAARFASGYLIQLVPDVKPIEGPEGPAADFTDLHAWCEVFLPGAGWIGLDPTSGLLTGEGHIPLACTPDPSGAAPVTGLVEPANVEFGHKMELTRIHESPRVTRPYTEAQWSEVETLAAKVDEQLAREKVNLTMGGEPTFVSIDDMEGVEWNTAALGDKKRELAGGLLLRLRDAWAPGGLLHYGQGKWYPGEELPRWSLSCFWRTDGKPIWHNPLLLGDPVKPAGYGMDEADAFAKKLAEQLGVDPGKFISAYEDIWHFVEKEAKLPVNVDPLDAKLENANERKRLARHFTRGLGQPVGYVLPLRADRLEHAVCFQTCDWPLRTKHLFLVPGDSPIGLRLPLNSLPWSEFPDRLPFFEEDPTAEKASLPDRFEIVPSAAPEASRVRRGHSYKGLIGTAICIEPRDGCLFIFLPPMEKLEASLAMYQAIEQAAQALNLRIVLEGYTPSYDDRIRNVKITPDPGVIEVNMPPVETWNELEDKTRTLYEEARKNRLGTEKFMLDGRHSGTGGGNHIVLGGKTPAESPFLRRPDVLASMLRYWQNHPSLSYLFSGLFIGPTSQSPRVDEGRGDSIHELEIALAEIERAENPPPWMVDRALRHLLVDLTGNTHRAEFCIDKLYSPDSSTGRLGLIEFRAFEMPPHAEMSLAQQVLIRALVARFWTEPYRRPLIRWGTALHDRFMLPYFIRQDFELILDEMDASGFTLRFDHFAPHFEFRYPMVGSVARAGVNLILRQASEPWYVLGEEPAGGGTSRYVDSSCERIQLEVQGLTGDRFAVTCNGKRIPLHPTGEPGNAIAGIRYRAWQPWSCLHPSIPVHTPLVFDLLDTWSMRSVGGCTYHVSHPGGRNYGSFPVNANEAEARRIARFFTSGHTPGPVENVPALKPNPDFPLTLDLRRA